MLLLRSKVDKRARRPDIWQAISDDRLQLLASYYEVATSVVSRSSFPRRLLRAIFGQRHAPPVQLDLSRPIAEATGCFERVTAVADGYSLSRDHLVASIAEISLRLAKGGMLEVRISSHDGTYDQSLRPIAGDLQTAMLAAGLYLERIELSVDKVVGQARKIIDWNVVITKSGTRNFVESLYEQVLRRHADPSGLDNYLHELTAGASREHLIKIFLISNERLALVERYYSAQLYDRV